MPENFTRHLSPFAETSLEFKVRISDTLHAPLKLTDAEPHARTLSVISKIVFTETQSPRGSSVGKEKNCLLSGRNLEQKQMEPTPTTTH